MSLEALRTQTCTYWSPSTPDGYGNKAYVAPTQLKCRWQRHRQEYVDDQGVTFTSSGIVYPNALVALGGFLLEGISAESNPQSEPDAYRIRIVERSQNPSNAIVVYKVIVG